MRLPNVGPDGQRGNLWYRGEPARLDEITVADAITLGDIRVEAFAGGEQEAERAGQAAKAAAQAIIAAYEREAHKLIALFEIEAGIVEEIEAMNQRTIGLRPGLIEIQTPARRLTNGRIRVLSVAVFLPSVRGRDEPLWQPISGWRHRA